MDNLTHSLVGLLIGRAFPKDWAPYAVPTAIVAANVPDIDVITLVDTATYITYHRHLTHALIAIPAMAALAVVLVRGWQRFRGRAPVGGFGPQWGVALLGVVSHVALDMTNSYGTPVWLPFSNMRESWDLFFIIDPLLWGVLLAAALFGRNRLAAGVGLAAVVLYAAATVAIKSDIEGSVSGLLVDGQTPEELRLFPGPWTPWDWTGYARTTGGDYSLRWTEDAATFSRFDVPDPELMEELRQTRLGASYLDFTRYPLVVSADDGAVTLGDFRFVRDGNAVFSCRFAIEPDGRLGEGSFEF